MNLSAAYMKRQQEWLEEGEERGSDRKSREVAIAALRNGLSIELIMELTGLSSKEIEKLRESLG
jgi:predicted transposase/invertase (TIGR01784 family)